MEREKFGSRIGFILVSAGCAIGIGNVWKFPYMVGQYGGGAFVLFYILFLVILGMPILMVEFTLGRASRKSPVKMYQMLEKPGHKWHFHGYVCMGANYLLMMFYTTVAGWMLYYLYASVSGKYEHQSGEQIVDMFTGMTGSPWIMILCVAIVVVLGFLVNSMGLQKGLERVSKIIMILLLILIGVLAVNSIFLDGGKEGLLFYLKPDFERMKEVGVSTVIIGAMTQAFFTLSIGAGSMAIFGSYINKDRSLMGESINVAVLDTIVAVCSGLIIFPACSAYNIDVTAGPELLFITLPNVFNHIPGGRFWSVLFFMFMVFAAFSTVLAVFENIVSMCMDQFKWSRKKACLINIPLMFALSLPCALGGNLLSKFHPLGEGTQILDLEDHILSYYLLPIGSLIFVLFCVSRFGWGWKSFIAEANQGKGLKVHEFMRPYMTVVLPFIIVMVFILNII